ncbi:MAG: bifunctional [glutamine synthetase] adenylyltransferase/[glutamine synthetase]-adenylyl-L-tyrosine phosphorylase [Alphaproteobacteria bacterium]|nr:bifunctional [glutamine synthetase] adenylyltransferase/[glutamine synthetase]-adenylyl-L-tyrosine phosphorylase [Alphaproteobacteria bacterium]
MKFPIDERVSPAAGDPARQALGFERWEEAAAQCDDPTLAARMRALSGDLKAATLLGALFAHSPFLTHCAAFEPAFLCDAVETGPDQALADLMESVKAQLADETDQARLMTALRIAKRRVALLAAAADISGAWPLEMVTGALSDLAELACRQGLAFLLRREAQRGNLVLAHPEDPEKDCGVIVLGMGKFGARELNYSSDIDIIVFYDHEKLDYRGRKSLPECMIALTKDLVKILDERTVDGYVFRTDLRLRPDPGATPVAVSLVAAESYYEGFGQNWERAAMIKARPVAGDAAAGAAFIRFLRPFIWRKSLDFAAIQDIHSIKRQINAHRGGRAIAVAGHNIKLGRGGIREIEFFAQTQQLIWGGRQPEVRSSRTLDALHALAAAGHVDAHAATELEEAYRFLRQLEHRLQMIDDKQTQTLPDSPERLAEIAGFCGFDGIDAFAAGLTRRLQTVETHYAGLFEEAPALSVGGNLVFTGGENDPETVGTITGMGFTNADSVCSTIRGWHHGRIRATRSTRARELLTELTPTLLSALAATASPDDAFMRFDEFLSRLPAGVPVFSLFYSNPSLLDLVAELMGNAPKLAQHLAHRPNLLDSVLTPAFSEPPPPFEALAADLEKALAEATDYQEVLDISRRWAADRKFQVGVQTLRAMLAPEKAARAFADIADAVLDRLCPWVEAEFARAHGHVPNGSWCILALGKMGGHEMTATSDMDLILVYDCPDPATESDGTRPLAAPVWFARLTQRIVNALTAQTGEGTLYEVDMRLRPSGNSGPIAASIEAFERYQADSAWTWEHMALTRARVVTAKGDVGAKVEDLIGRTLGRARDPDRLVMDVAEMRERMAREHKATSHWEVKHLRGGLVDIEFTAQYLQLRHGATHPGIFGTNTKDALDRAAAAGLLADADRDCLVEAWRLWSAVQLVLRQTIAGDFDEKTAPSGLKDVLVRTTGLVDFKTLVDRMDDCAQAALEVFDRLVGQPGRLVRERIGPDET